MIFHMSIMQRSEAPGAVPEWTLGWRMLRALEHAGVKVEDIADEIGVSRATVSRWTHDKGPVREIYLRHWALRTGVDFDWLRTGRRGVPGPAEVDTNFDWSKNVPAQVSPIRRITARATTSGVVRRAA